jgi:hypothetical protein
MFVPQSDPPAGIRKPGIHHLRLKISRQGYQAPNHDEDDGFKQSPKDLKLRVTGHVFWVASLKGIRGRVDFHQRQRVLETERFRKSSFVQVYERDGPT